MWGRKRRDIGVPVAPQIAFNALSPITPYPVTSQGIAGTAGWKAIPGYVPEAYQVGAYNGGLLSQYPANLPGVQRHCGVEFLHPGWYTPTVGFVANGGSSQTTRPNNIAGAQRNGAAFSGSIGPINAQANAAAVVAAQVRQSGLAAMQFAQRLNPAYNSLTGG